MKVDKVQIEVLKALMTDPSKVVYHINAISEEVALMPNSFAAYIVPSDKLQLMIIGAQDSFALGTLLEAGEKAEDLTQLMPTDEYRIAGKVQRFLFGGDKARPVYIRTQRLANFAAPILYQTRYDPTGPVYVHEVDGYGKSKLVGVVMPSRIKEEE